MLRFGAWVADHESSPERASKNLHRSPPKRPVLGGTGCSMKWGTICGDVPEVVAVGCFVLNRLAVLFLWWKREFLLEEGVLVRGVYQFAIASGGWGFGATFVRRAALTRIMRTPRCVGRMAENDLGLVPTGNVV